MNGPEGEKQAQKVGALLGAVAALVILRRLRKRRKAKKLLKQRAKARARLAEQRRKEQEAARKGKGRKGREKGGRERSMVQQLVRFAVFQFLKKLIMQQIKQMEVDLGKGRLGKRIVEATEGSTS
ncbi:MAG: hypothetical protein QME88_05655 [Actinomycetota bacterium]|nr:hypothetical protein [Actinomycetota bacterium]